MKDMKDIWCKGKKETRVKIIPNMKGEVDTIINCQ